MIRNVTGRERYTVSSVVIQPSVNGGWGNGTNPYPGSVSASQRMPKPLAASIAVDGASIIYTVDGTTPDATHGTVVGAGGSFEVGTWAEVKSLKLIRQTADATVEITYGLTAAESTVH